ncbi:MAG: hypothetical protein GW905_08575 [Rhodobacterales bacterium]|nr:hypothetical protein [Rhodobacterales bacterium]
MKPLPTSGQDALAALLCLSLLVWAVVPAMSHASAVFDALQEHATVIAEHGLNQTGFAGDVGVCHSAAILTARSAL